MVRLVFVLLSWTLFMFTIMLFRDAIVLDGPFEKRFTRCCGRRSNKKTVGLDGISDYVVKNSVLLGWIANHNKPRCINSLGEIKLNYDWENKFNFKKESLFSVRTITKRHYSIKIYISFAVPVSGNRCSDCSFWFLEYFPENSNSGTGIESNKIDQLRPSDRKYFEVLGRINLKACEFSDLSVEHLTIWANQTFSPWDQFHISPRKVEHFLREKVWTEVGYGFPSNFQKQETSIQACLTSDLVSIRLLFGIEFSPTTSRYVSGEIDSLPAIKLEIQLCQSFTFTCYFLTFYTTTLWSCMPTSSTRNIHSTLCCHSCSLLVQVLVGRRECAVSC